MRLFAKVEKNTRPRGRKRKQFTVLLTIPVKKELAREAAAKRRKLKAAEAHKVARTLTMQAK